MKKVETVINYPISKVTRTDVIMVVDTTTSIAITVRNTVVAFLRTDSPKQGGFIDLYKATGDDYITISTETSKGIQVAIRAFLK